MIVNKYISEEIDGSRFANAPMPECNVIKRYASDDIKLLFEKNPSTIGQISVVDIPYALVALNADGEYIFASSIEKNDLRTVSSMIGVPVKCLQEEEGVKGFFSPAHIVIYGDGKREDLGVLTIPENKEEIIDLLMEYAIDSLDLIEDPREEL